MANVEDGLIVGSLAFPLANCGVCGKNTKCIYIFDVVMPEDISVRATILWNRAKEERIDPVGVGCGCYAKFHRQVAHIEDKRKKP